jgi:3-dehydroquinate dehydratase II
MPKTRIHNEKILIANGVNLDLLGSREPDIYGRATLIDMKRNVREFIKNWKGTQFSRSVQLVFFQTNSEERFLREISKNYAGAVINAGAWSHTSLAIADRLKGLSLPYVEVHVSNINKREAFRKKSFLKSGALASISGKGIKGYEIALEILLEHLFE